MVEKYVLKLIEFLECIVVLDIPEFCYGSLADKFHSNIKLVLDILNTNLSKITSSLKARMFDLLGKINELKLAGQENLKRDSLELQDPPRATIPLDIKSRFSFSGQGLFAKKGEPASNPFRDMLNKMKEPLKSAPSGLDEQTDRPVEPKQPDPTQSLKLIKQGSPVLEFYLQQLLRLAGEEEVKKHFKEDFEAICNSLMEERDSESAFSIKSIGPSLLHSLSQSDHIHKVAPRIFTFCIKLLSFYLDGKVVSEDPAEAGRDEARNPHPDDDEADLSKRQVELVEKDIIPDLCQVFCSITNDQIKIQIVDLFISLLSGGNQTVQMKFLEVIQADAEGEFFAGISQMIRENSSKLYAICKNARDDRIKVMFMDQKLENLKVIRVQPFEIHDLTEKNTKIFRFLQLLCEGHNFELQAKMREQRGDFKDVNFLSESVVLFGSLQKFIDEEVQKMLSQVLDFLIESIQGPNKENQDFIFASKFFEFIDDYLVELHNLKELKEEYRERHLKLVVKKSVAVVMSLLDGNTNNHKYYVKFNKFVKVETLMNFLADEFVNYLNNSNHPVASPHQISDIDSVMQSIKSPTFDEDLTEIFQTFFLIKYVVVNLKDEYQGFFANLEGSELFAYKFFEKNSAAIEIVFNDVLELIFFISQPASMLVSESDKQTFLDNVRRDTHINKLNDLLLYAQRFMLLMDYNNYTGKSGGRIIRLAQAVHEKINKVTIQFTFAYCLLLFFVDNFGSEGFLSLPDDSAVFRVGRYVLLVLCLLRILVFLLIVAKLIVMESWGQIFVGYRRIFEEAVC